MPWVLPYRTLANRISQSLCSRCKKQCQTAECIAEVFGQKMLRLRLAGCQDRESRGSMGYLLVLLILQGTPLKVLWASAISVLWLLRREGAVVREAQAGAPGFPPTRPDQGHRIKARGLVQGNIKTYFSFQLEKSTYVYRVWNPRKPLQGHSATIMSLLWFQQKITVIRDHNEWNITMLKKPFESL